ncbi:rhamnan synthesis F family protein [uncultured Tateyamaria sp.]|uniref:rhamnan synthesis F family protein n=1 Tax=uncultured Tateyamaria sp. TaxID=455651 RepID=UPI002638F905|nr:rhamnan synthesis F family protein [uncultured Tateyamaria sp.]
MASLPFWKIQRELSRFGRQLAAAPGNIWRYWTERPFYDMVTARQIRVSDGGIPPSDNVALFLIFPADGILKSHLHSLRWLTDNGYAPLVISNVPLTDTDRATLHDHAWRILERPNVGYDFGGYRDGILSLADRLPSLKRLVIVNDSAWFPMPGTDGWLSEAETSGYDVVSASFHWGIARVDTEDFRDIRWEFSTDDRNFHYGSFALSVGANVLRDPAFLGFWKRYRLTGDKSKTVRRGETGFSQWILRSGYSHTATLDLTTLDTDLAAMPDDQVIDLAQNLILHEDMLMRGKKLEVLAGPDGRDPKTLIPLILTSIARQGVSYALPHHIIRAKGYPFLKKSPLWACPDTQSIMLDFIDGITGDQGPDIQSEAEALVAKRRDRLQPDITPLYETRLALRRR